MTCPGIKVKNFNVINAFLIIIKFEPNAVNILNDVPIDLPQSTNFLPGFNNIIFNDQRFDLSPYYENMNTLIDKYQDYLDNVKQKLEDLQNDIQNNLNPETSNQTYYCPVDDIDIDQLLNDLENGVETDFITITDTNIDNPPPFDENKAVVSYCDQEDKLNVVDMINIPDISKGAYNPPNPPDNLACLFNDDKLKNVATYIEDKILNPDDNILNTIDSQVNDDSLQNIYDQVQNYLDEHNSNIEDVNQINAPLPPTVPTEDILKDKYNIKFQLGVPMVVLDSKHQIYLQIINKKVQVTNLIDFSGNYLEIEQEIDLNHPGYIAFFTDGYSHKLFYYSTEEGILHTDQITIRKNLTIEYIGIDDLYRKHYCGLIYDIQILTFQNTNFEQFLLSQAVFEPPAGVLYYYDWHKDRIKYNLVYPLPDLQPPVKMYSQGGYTKYILHTEKDPYHFMEVGYLTQFFCWRVMTKSDFSIAFWFNKLEYENGLNETDYRCLIYDEINNYGLYYNDYEKRFKVDLNGSTYYFDYIIEDNLWYFCNFKYSSYEKKLYLNIRNIDQDGFDNYTEFTIDLNTIDLQRFHLSAMLARKHGTFFDQYFNCKFGTLALFNNKRESAEEYDQFKKERIVIKILDL